MANGTTPHIGHLGPGEVALLKDIAEAAAEKAVAKGLVAIGLDPNNPIESQSFIVILRKLAAQVQDPELIKDLAWTRTTRLRSDGLVGKALLTAMGISVVGAANALWTGIASIITRPH